MEDKHIVDLYWARSEQAIKETAAKYEKYCYSVAYNILANHEDAQESVNDTYHDAWNSIPPHRPANLSTYLAKITRRISIDKYRSRTAQKRGGSNIEIAFQELSECIPSQQNVESELVAKELAQAIERFVQSLPKVEQYVFYCRYWYLDSISSIAKQFGFTENKVNLMLHRQRRKLHLHLEKEALLNEKRRYSGCSRND